MFPTVLSIKTDLLAGNGMGPGRYGQYDKLTSPNFRTPGKKLDVSYSFDLNFFMDINDATGGIEYIGSEKFKWLDPRLAFDTNRYGVTQLVLSDSSDFWGQDVKFKGKTIKSITPLDHLFRIRSDGSIKMWTKSLYVSSGWLDIIFCACPNETRADDHILLLSFC